MEFLCHKHLFIRGESNARYNQTVLTISEKHGIDTACVYTSEDLFKKMRKDSNLQDEMKFLHHAIPIFNPSAFQSPAVSVIMFSYIQS